MGMDAPAPSQPHRSASRLTLTHRHHTARRASRARVNQAVLVVCVRLMADHGILFSMSRSGNVWDNAAMESFFSSLKTERTGSKTYRTRDEARADVFD